MKPLNLFSKVLLILLIITVFSNCKKATEDVIDCLFEAAYFSVSENVSGDTASFTVTYDGDHTLQNSITWDFGDGTTSTLSGTTASHTYSSGGTYTVKIMPTIRNGNSSCTPDLTKKVTIN